MVLKGKKDEVLKNIRRFIDRNRNLFSRDDYFAFQRRMHSILRNNPNYEELKDLENSLLKYVSILWKRDLTRFEEFDGSSDFLFLVTCPTVRADNFTLKDFVSASLISSRHLGTFNKIPICVCLEIDDDAFLGISSRDMHSLADSGDTLADSYYYLNKYKGEKIFSKFQVDSLLSPSEIEASLVKQNIEENGNILYMGENSVYSDILLKGNKIKVSGVLILSNADAFWIEEARKLAQRLNVSTKIVDCRHYYQMIGLIHDEEDLIKYHLYDLSLIEAILKQKFHVTNGESNLSSDQIGNKTIIRSMDSPDYLMADFDRNDVNIIIKGDYRDIRMHYDGEAITYCVDNNYISRKEMETLLDPETYEKGK